MIDFYFNIKYIKIKIETTLHKEIKNYKNLMFYAENNVD